jgi:excisionase family DNA binding protein
MVAVTITQINPDELELLIENAVKKVLIDLKEFKQIETDIWFDLRQLCEYLSDKPSKATVYGWVNTKTIPVHKGGKKLRFLKSEIDNWLKNK